LKLTARDLELLHDIALSHVLSRDQVIRIGYFTSISRANRRLTALTEEGYLRIYDSPFVGQRIYWIGRQAIPYLSVDVQKLVGGRVGSPRFLRHSLAVTEVRIALLERGATGWRYESELWRRFEVQGISYEVRPDGSVRNGQISTFIEVDMGNVSPSKFGAKIDAYKAIQRGSNVKFNLLIVAPTKARLNTLLKGDAKALDILNSTFDELGIKLPGAWS
jgi:hypothetical protein